MIITTTTVVTAVRLSCNHVLSAAKGEDLPDDTTEGTKVECPKCSQRSDGRRPMRRIRKALVAEVPVDDLTDALELSVGMPAIWASIRGLFSLMAADILDGAAAEQRQHENRPAPGDSPYATIVDGTAVVYDVWTAQEQHRAMQAWIAGGRQGDRPDTSHLDALNAAHAAGKPRSGRKVGKVRKPRNADPVRLAANEAKKAKGKGGRHNSRRVTDDELDTYVAQARAAHPDSRSVDLRDFALWVDEVSVSFKRWDAAWERTGTQQ